MDISQSHRGQVRPLTFGFAWMSTVLALLETYWEYHLAAIIPK
jgi:hypothetical protein